MVLEKGLHRFPHAVKDVFDSLPRIFKLLVVFAIVNAVLIAGITGTRIVTFQNTVFVKTIDVGVYCDANCTSLIQGIDWGILEPGENRTNDIYLRNEGNTEISLSIWAANWSSSEAEEFMSFDAIHQSEPVQIGETILVRLILHLLPDIRDIDSFNFDIVIETTG